MAEFLTIAEASRRIAAKTLSPVELTRLCLDRVRRLDPTLNAFITVTEDTALAASRAAEARIMAAGQRTPLDGIPIGLKDIFKTRGIRTTAHSRQLIDYLPEEDAAATQRLAEAGTVLMGKLATHEFAFGGPSFDLPWPPARNPWNPEHFTAGSSSGTSAAVAAGMILGGTGSDTGGSIRGPASLCGIAGIKPTYGLVSRYGVLPLAFSLDHAGPMAWTVEDCALMLQAMAGHDPRDPASAKRSVPDYAATMNGTIKGVRVGVIRHFFADDNPVTETSLKSIDAALDVLRGLGAEIRSVTLAPLAEWHAAGFLIMLAEAYGVHERWLRTAPEKYGAMMRDRVSLGALVSAADYMQAQRRRRALVDELDAAAADCDILVSASQAGEAPRLDAVSKWGVVETPSYNLPFNLSGWPALSLCCGFGQGGLPLGVQLAAKPFQEPLLLRVGHAYEQATQWRQHRPALATA